jgi:hypothetical protein
MGTRIELRGLRGGGTRLARFVAGLVVLVSAASGWTQELDPRAYRALPIGLEFVAFSYQFSSGNVVLDPTVPIEDLSGSIHSVSASYLGSVNVFGRSASFSFAVPYVYMSASGVFEGELSEGSRSGFADSRARFTVNLLGGPALTQSEWASFRQKRTLGVGLSVSMPTGQYDSNHLINFGANRWGLKPEIGYTSVKGRWVVEIALGTWFFSSNKDGFGGVVIQQDPIVAAQGHVSYNFPGGYWLALDGNYFKGGRTTYDGSKNFDLQTNSRVGLTFSIPLSGRHSIRLAAHTGAYTRFGADFNVGTFVYQYRWGKP